MSLTPLGGHDGRAFEILLMVALPGKTFHANPTATGHVPVYKANGTLSYVVTLATLCALVHKEMYVCGIRTQPLAVLCAILILRVGTRGKRWDFGV